MISGVTVNLAATASDSDGTVVRVRFLANNNPVGSTATTAPYATTWIPAAPGVYSVVAEATDDADNVPIGGDDGDRGRQPGTRGCLHVAGQRVGDPARQRDTLAVNATDADGTIAKVQFFVDGATLGTALAAFPYRTTWTPVAEGVYRITAAATDNAGVTTNSSTVNVLVTGATSAGDTVVNGIIIGLNESGTFSAISVRGKSITFIGTSTVNGANKTYFFSGLPVGSNGSFSILDPQGRPAISGTFSGASAFGTLTTTGFPSAARRSCSRCRRHGRIRLPRESRRASDQHGRRHHCLDVRSRLRGGMLAVGRSAVDATGTFDVVSADVRFTGKADPATGFLSGARSAGRADRSRRRGQARPSATAPCGIFDPRPDRRGWKCLIAGLSSAAPPRSRCSFGRGSDAGAAAARLRLPGSLADRSRTLFRQRVGCRNDDWARPLGQVRPAPPCLRTDSDWSELSIPSGSKDAAILVTLCRAIIAPGGSSSGATGVGLVEIYDVDTLPLSLREGDESLDARLCGHQSGWLIAGFGSAAARPRKS